MGSFSDYLENALLNHTFKGSAFTQPTNLYIALSTADPLDTGAGVAEPAFASGYYRMVCNSWSVSTTGAISNTATVAFPSASGPWGTISHFGIYDASGIGAGNLLAYGSLSISKTVTQGDILQFPSGSIVASLA